MKLERKDSPQSRRGTEQRATSKQRRKAKKAPPSQSEGGAPAEGARCQARLCRPERKFSRRWSQLRMVKATTGMVVVLSVWVGKMLASHI
jgi:hypothetical protein